MIYLTGVTFTESEAVNRTDFGVLATPASGTHHQRGQYPTWAADNGFYTAPRPDGEGYDGDTAAQVRYADPAQKQIDHWINWLETVGGDDDCLFATLPDVVGDYRATWERSARYVARVRAAGFKVAIVLQDGIENDPFIWHSVLNAADVLFIGGSDEFKLGPACAALVAQAKARGLWVHMGRVNSYKRISYAASIGCDSADGTYLKFGKKVDRVEHVGVVESWLDRVNGVPPAPTIAATVAA
jgi:hypothetical protein